MKVLIIGTGGREHALAWRLAQCASVDSVVCPNGSPGIAQVAETPAADLKSPAAWAGFAATQKIDLVAVGPEAPLADGVTDAIEARGIRVFGPSKAGAQIEASKVFAKEIMAAADIPTARYESFTEYAPALDYARGLGLPVVVKADGLAAGKGVAICTTQEELEIALGENLTEKRFGQASQRVVVEEFLEGEEASILALTDGREVFPLVPSQDHKRAGDGDTGPNTGGMGAYAPAPCVTNEVLTAALSMVLRPCVDELAARGIAYKGVLYAGLILTKDGPKVLEFNCRFGDPETQAVLPLVDGDLAEAMVACCEGRLTEMVAPVSGSGGGPRLTMRPAHSVCLVLASGGYPGSYDKGKSIHGLDKAAEFENAMVFHAGTKAGPDGEVLTAGGRVLGLTAWASTLESALSQVYRMAETVTFEGVQYRRDIAHRALRPGRTS